MSNATPKKKKSGTPAKPGLVRRFVSVLGPGLVTGAADDDPSGIATYSHRGRAARHRAALDGVADLAADGRRPDDVRAHRDGRPAAGSPARCARSSRAGRSSSSRSRCSPPTRSTSRRISPGWPTRPRCSRARLPLLRRALRRRHRLGDDPAALLPDRRGPQVARARPLRLRHHRHPRRARTGAAVLRDAFVPSLPGQRGVGDARGDPRHDDLPLPLLLAGLAGGRGGEGDGRGGCCRSRRGATHGRSATGGSTSASARSSRTSSCSSSS